MNTLTVAKELLAQIKAVIPTVEVDGKDYARIDNIVVGPQGTTLSYRGKPIFTMNTPVGPGEVLTIVNVDVLWAISIND
jgi:hypothetical protein